MKVSDDRQRTRSGVCDLRRGDDDARSLAHVGDSCSGEEEGAVNVGLQRRKEGQQRLRCVCDRKACLHRSVELLSGDV